MLRAFLIAWTLVAGLAAGGLMYIIGWRPQAQVVAEQVSSTTDGSRTAASVAATAPTASSPGRAVSPGGSDPQTAPKSVPTGAAWVDPDPASTGSVGMASARGPTRTPRRVDELTPPAARADSSSQSQGQTTPSERRTGVAPVADDPGLPPARPIALPRSNSTRPEIVALPAEDDAEADPAAPRARAARDSKAEERPTAATASVAPASPQAVTAPRPRPLSEAAPRPRSRDLAARSEPEEARASTQVSSDQAYREQSAATSRRAARAAERSARAAARKEERQKVRTAALEETESSSETREQPLEARRQARLDRRQARERGARVARNGSLEQLLDEFSRSGDDYLHERTIRIGTRYLVERTTRHGTQYFYEQGPR